MNNTYQLHPAVYISDDITVKKSILTRWLNSSKKRLRAEYYVIYISDRDDELLTMIPALDIELSVYGMYRKPIVGVGIGYYGSMGLIHRIIKDVLEEKGSVEKEDIVSFFKEREEAFHES